MGGVQVGLYVVVAVIAIAAVIAAYRLDEHRNTTGLGFWALALDRLVGGRNGDDPTSRTRRIGLALLPVALLAGVAVAGVWYATSGGRELASPPAGTAGTDAPPDTGPPDAAAGEDGVPAAGTGAALTDVRFEASDDVGDPAGVAVVVSEQVAADGSGENVILVREDASSDAIVAGALQSLFGAPLLFTDGEEINPATLAEIDRMGRPAVHIVGGQDVLSATAEEELVAAGHDVHRHAGATGVETAVDVAARHFADAQAAVLAPNPSDGSAALVPAFVAGNAAARAGVPVLLSDAGGLSAATAAHLDAATITAVTVIGGVDVLGDAVLEDIEALGVSAERVSAEDPTALAVAAAEDLDGTDIAGVVLAEGQADGAWPGLALTGVFAGRFGAPVVLSDAGELPAPTRDFLAVHTGLELLCMPGVDQAACDAARGIVDEA